MPYWFWYLLFISLFGLAGWVMSNRLDDDEDDWRNQ